MKKYDELTYREKFFRNLWCAPLIALLFLFPKDFEALGISRDLAITLSFAFAAVLIVYTFVRWQRER